MNIDGAFMLGEDIAKYSLRKMFHGIFFRFEI